MFNILYISPDFQYNTKQLSMFLYFIIDIHWGRNETRIFRISFSNKYTITLKNKFDSLQEISETLTPNVEYENFVNALVEAAVECIVTKLRAKHRVPWETQAVRKNEITLKQHPYVKREI